MAKQTKSFSDDEILQGLQSGTSEVIDFVYRSNYPMVLKYIMANSGNIQDARDVFQESMIALIKMVSKPEFALTAKWSTVIYSIMQKIWLKQLNRVKSRETMRDQWHDNESTDAEDEQENLNVGLIKQLLEKLTEQCRKMLKLKYWFKLRDKEIASKLGLSGSDYVKTQRYRCIRKLKELYSQTKISDNDER